MFTARGALSDCKFFKPSLYYLIAQRNIWKIFFMNLHAWYIIAPKGSSGEDAGGSQLGRGAMRGRRVLASELVTRPEHLVSKKG